jgi:hypothetical protein
MGERMTLFALGQLLDDLEEEGLIDKDTTYEEFTTLMEELERAGYVVEEPTV